MSHPKPNPPDYWYRGSYTVWKNWMVGATREDRSRDFLHPPPRIEDPKPFMTPAADSEMRTYWGNGVPLCSRPVSRAFTRKIEDYELLEEPFNLVVEANVEAAKATGLLPVDIYAVPTTRWQGAIMLRMDLTWTEIAYVGSGRVGLVIGRRWVPFPPELGGRFSKLDSQRMRKVEEALKEVFAGIANPEDPVRAAERLLESIPGIGQEIPSDQPHPDSDIERSR
jgi:hypothetical protein